MNKQEVLRNVLLGLGAVAMVVVLAFLYDKTQTVDMREQNQVLDALRLLKEIDSRWDVEVLRTRIESASEPPAGARREAGRALEILAAALRKTPGPSLAAALPELRRAILEKEDLVRKFRAENAAVKTALAEFFRSVSEARSQAAERKPPLPVLDAALSQLIGAAYQDFGFAQGAQPKSMAVALVDLRTAQSALLEPLRSKVLQAGDAAEALLKRADDLLFKAKREGRNRVVG